MKISDFSRLGLYVYGPRNLVIYLVFTRTKVRQMNVDIIDPGCKPSSLHPGSIISTFIFCLTLPDIEPDLNVEKCRNVEKKSTGSV